MRSHNSYTLKGKFGMLTALNELAPDFWQKAFNSNKWANYIALTGENGEFVCSDAELEFINCNPLNGALRAVYTAEIDCPQGNYTSVALCITNDVFGKMSVADLGVGVGGDKISVRAVINLEVSGSGVRFCEGENLLVKKLLGCGESGEISFAWGECDYPDRPCSRNGYLIGESLPVSVNASGGEISFSCNSPTYGKELLLYINGYPVMRALRPFSYNVYTYAVTAQNNGAVIGDNPENVYNLSVDGVSQGIIDFCRIPDYVAPVFNSYVRDLGAAGNVKSDPACEYMVFISESYAEVYKVDSLDLTLCLRVPIDGEYVEICNGGTLVVWSDTTLTLYEKQNGEYNRYDVALPRRDKQLIVREGDVYHAFYLQGSYLYRGVLSRSGNSFNWTQSESNRISYLNRLLLERSGNALVRADYLGKVKTTSADITSQFNFGSINTRSLARNQAGVGDCIGVSHEISNGVTASVIYDFVHGVIEVKSGLLYASGKLIYGQEGAYVFDYFNGVHKIEGDYDLSGVTGACLCGDGLFAVKNGKLYSYYVSHSSGAVRLPNGSAGKTAVMNVRNRIYQGKGRGAEFTVAQT